MASLPERVESWRHIDQGADPTPDVGESSPDPQGRGNSTGSCTGLPKQNPHSTIHEASGAGNAAAEDADLSDDEPVFVAELRAKVTDETTARPDVAFLAAPPTLKRYILDRSKTLNQDCIKEERSSELSSARSSAAAQDGTFVAAAADSSFDRTAAGGDAPEGSGGGGTGEGGSFSVSPVSPLHPSAVNSGPPGDDPSSGGGSSGGGSSGGGGGGGSGSVGDGDDDATVIAKLRAELTKERKEKAEALAELDKERARHRAELSRALAAKDAALYKLHSASATKVRKRGRPLLLDEATDISRADYRANIEAVKAADADVDATAARKDVAERKSADMERWWATDRLLGEPLAKRPCLLARVTVTLFEKMVGEHELLDKKTVIIGSDDSDDDDDESWPPALGPWPPEEDSLDASRDTVGGDGVEQVAPTDAGRRRAKRLLESEPDGGVAKRTRSNFDMRRVAPRLLLDARPLHKALTSQPAVLPDTPSTREHGFRCSCSADKRTYTRVGILIHLSKMHPGTCKKCLRGVGKASMKKHVETCGGFVGAHADCGGGGDWRDCRDVVHSRNGVTVTRV